MLKFIQRITSTLLALALPVALLTACGGGSGTGGDNLVGGGPQGTITLSVGKSQLPAQSGSFVQPISSLYSTTVIAKAYLANGSPVPTGTKIQFMMDGGNTYSGALYPQPFETEDVTQPDGTIVKVPKAFWSYNVDAAAGQALMVFHAWDRPGTVTIRASWEDPSSKKTIVASTQIVVGSAIATGLPANVFANLVNGPVYVANQGKNDTGIIDILVTDPVGEPVSAPPAPNVKVELLNPELGATLQGVNGAVGTIVNTTTINGKAQVSLRAGTVAGVAKVRITADALDNNVENGIQSPIINDVTFFIEDGRVASITLTGTNTAPVLNNATGIYTRGITAVVSDVNGNPVPNTQVKFTLIDSPVINFPAINASFAITGNDGIASPGGNRFDALNVAGMNGFITQRNDQLILTPDPQGAARALTGARTISQVIPSNTVLVTDPFSSNVPAGANVNIPWTVGRAQFGNIASIATTDAQGRATTSVSYPMSRVGQPTLLAAQVGNGVAATMQAIYVGTLNVSLTSSVTTIQRGTAQDVVMCARNQSGDPFPTTINLTGGAAGITVTPTPIVTASNGCATVRVDASGYTGSADVKLNFSIPGTPAAATVTVQGEGILTVAFDGTASVAGTTKFQKIKVTLKTSGGTPIANRVITHTSSCTPSPPPCSISVTPASASTTDAGEAIFQAAYGDSANDSFTVTFTSSNGETATVSFLY